MNSNNAASNSSNAGAKSGNAIKSGITKIHGLGEALRGNINSFADNITNTDASKSQNVAARGEREFATGHYEGTGAGVTPADTTQERLNRDIQGEGGHIGTGDARYGSAGRV